MSIRALDRLLTGQDRVKRNDLLVLLCIANYAPDDGTLAWIPRKLICRQTGLDERSVRRILRRLTTAGELDIVENIGKVVPLNAKIPPAELYHLRCLEGESTRTKCPDILSGEEKATDILSAQTGHFVRADLKDPIRTGSIDHVISNSPPSQPSNGNGKSESDPTEIRRQMAAALNRNRERLKRSH